MCQHVFFHGKTIKGDEGGFTADQMLRPPVPWGSFLWWDVWSTSGRASPHWTVTGETGI